MRECKKSFSSSNFSLVIFFTLIISSFIIEGIKVLNVWQSFTIPVFLILVITTFSWIFIKFTIFVPSNNNIKDYTNKGYSLNFLKSIYFSIFSSISSPFASFFSENKIVANVNCGKYKFKWTSKKIKLIHRFLDFATMLIFIPLGIFLGTWLNTSGIKQSFILFLILVLFIFRNVMCLKFSSVKVKNANEFYINVFPNIQNRFKAKIYGLATFSRVVLISQNIVEKGENILEKYVIEHEIGHIKDKKSIITVLFYYIFVPFYLTFFVGILSITFRYLIVFPLISYLIFHITIGRRLKESLEIKADEYAVSVLGKRKCLEALEIIKNSRGNKSINNILGFFTQAISIDKRISIINEKFSN